MAVKVESLARIGIGAPADAPLPEAAARPLSLQRRLAQARRRRRLARLNGAVESVLWIGGSGVVLTLAVAGLFGLR